jgi:Rieske Fe-S protein
MAIKLKRRWLNGIGFRSNFKSRIFAPGITVLLMKLIRRNLLAIVPAALLSIFGSSAMAAIGPTLKATKLGQKIVFQGYTYVCVKSKGKLIWKKGAKVVTSSPSAKPSETATPSATQSATATPTATPAPSESAGSLTFVAKSSDIVEGELKILDVKPVNKSTFPVSVTRAKGTGCQIEGAGGGLACPCHGSRFNAVTGAVTGGPAESPLRKYVVSEDAGSIFITA